MRKKLQDKMFGNAPPPKDAHNIVEGNRKGKSASPNKTAHLSASADHEKPSMTKADSAKFIQKKDAPKPPSQPASTSQSGREQS